jgi:hypothetical protein
MVLELLQPRIGSEIPTEVVAVAVAEVVKSDLVDVGRVDSLGDVNLARFDELL